MGHSKVFILGILRCFFQKVIDLSSALVLPGLVNFFEPYHSDHSGCKRVNYFLLESLLSILIGKLHNLSYSAHKIGWNSIGANLFLSFKFNLIFTFLIFHYHIFILRFLQRFFSQNGKFFRFSNLILILNLILLLLLHDLLFLLPSLNKKLEDLLVIQSFLNSC